jgi:hypothetical protein
VCIFQFLFDCFRNRPCDNWMYRFVRLRVKTHVQMLKLTFFLDDAPMLVDCVFIKYDLVF